MKTGSFFFQFACGNLRKISDLKHLPTSVFLLCIETNSWTLFQNHVGCLKVYVHLTLIGTVRTLMYILVQITNLMVQNESAGLFIQASSELRAYEYYPTKEDPMVMFFIIFTALSQGFWCCKYTILFVLYPPHEKKI